MSPYDLALRLRPGPAPSREQRLADRIRMVLETQPGQLPWAPEYGCDLSGLVGSTGADRLGEARTRITAALARWMPDIPVSAMKAELVDHIALSTDDRHPAPLAERALASRSISARIIVHLVVETEDGPLTIDATLEP